MNEEIKNILTLCANSKFDDNRHLACDILRNKIWNNVDVLLQKHNGRILLHFACLEAVHLDFIKVMIEECACSPRCRDNDGYLPLHMAAQVGDLDVCRYLVSIFRESVCLSAGNGRTPLHFACQNGHLQVAKIFLACSKECATMASVDGRLPIHLACLNGNVDLLKELIIAFPESVAFETAEGMTPLHIASQFNQAKLILELLEINDSIVLIRDSQGRTPVHVAFAHGSIDVINIFLKFIRDSQYQHLLCIRNEATGRFLIHDVCTTCSIELQLEIFNLSPQVCTQLDHRGYSLLHYLASWGNFPLFCRVLEHLEDLLKSSTFEFEPYLVAPGNRTVLHFAAQSSSLDLVMFISSKWPQYLNYRTTDTAETFPLHLSCYHGHLPIIRYLISNCPVVFNQLDGFQRPPMILYCSGVNLPKISIISIFVTNHSWENWWNVCVESILVKILQSMNSEVSLISSSAHELVVLIYNYCNDPLSLFAKDISESLVCLRMILQANHEKSNLLKELNWIVRKDLILSVDCFLRSRRDLQERRHNNIYVALSEQYQDIWKYMIQFL